MGIFDQMKDMAAAAEEAIKTHPDQVKQALDKLESVVDEQTGGKYHDKIVKADAKVDAYLDKQSGGAPGSTGAGSAAT